MSLREQIVESLVEYRKRVLSGKINCIPLKFTRFRSDFPGIRKAFYYVVTGATKSSKTQITTFLFVITPIFFYIENPTKLKPKIFYFPLEETKHDITLRIYSYIISYLTKGKIQISPEDLESVDERKPLPQEVLDIMNSEQFIKIAEVFEQCIEFCEDRNPTGIYKVVKNYMELHGKIEYEDKTFTKINDLGETVTETVQVFKKYIPDNEEEYVISITDHAGLLSEERGYTLKQTIEKHSEYNMILRNKYGVIPVLVQQQNQETTNLDAFKANKIRPTKDGLKDSKRPGEDCTVLIGITNPYAFGLDEYLGYKVNRLKDSLRILEIVLARKGRANGICPLYFNGATNEYKELPLPTENTIEEVYKYVENIRKSAREIPNKTKVFLIYAFNKLFKH